MLEDDDQQGLAHFVEHMAFNGTKHFPKQEIVKFIESIGMRFGPSVNAFTSFDETVYMLQVPTDKPEVLDKAFLILEDWAHDVSFDPTEIDKERGVIIEEWRLRPRRRRAHAGQAVPDPAQGLALRRAAADRQPGDHPELQARAAEAVLRRLVPARPDGGGRRRRLRQGRRSKRSIKEHFATDPGAGGHEAAPDRTTCPSTPGTLYAVATDKEAPRTSVSVLQQDAAARSRRRSAPTGSRSSSGCSARCCRTRFSEMAQKPDAPFLGAGAGRGMFVRTKEASTLSAGVKEDGIERGLEALFTEAERVATFGFTATELDRVKRNILRGLERAVTEKDKQPSARSPTSTSRNFTDGEPIPGIEYEMALHQRFLPEITLAEVNALAKDWVARHATASSLVERAQKAGLTVPDEAKLAARDRVGAQQDADGVRRHRRRRSRCSTRLPTAGRDHEDGDEGRFGITEWELSNGVKVVLKPTTFKEDEILFRAFSPGGTSLATDADFIPASDGRAGRRERRPRQVQRDRPAQDADRQGRVGAAVHRRARGRPARQRVAQGLETMFQLIYSSSPRRAPIPTIFAVMTTPDEVAAGQPEGNARIRVRAKPLNNDADPEPSARRG